MQILSTNINTHYSNNRTTSATQAAEPTSFPTDSFAPGLPEFAKEPFKQLLSSELPQGVSKGGWSEADMQEIGKAVFAAGILSSQDEVEGQDQAMGQPGKVVVANGLTCEFVSAGEEQFEAAIYGPGKTGEPSALYVKSGPEGLLAYGLLQHADNTEVRGQSFNGVDGYTVSGNIPN